MASMATRVTRPLVRAFRKAVRPGHPMSLSDQYSNVTQLWVTFRSLQQQPLRKEIPSVPALISKHIWVVTLVNILLFDDVGLHLPVFPDLLKYLSILIDNHSLCGLVHISHAVKDARRWVKRECFDTVMN